MVTDRSDTRDRSSHRESVEAQSRSRSRAAWATVAGLSVVTLLVLLDDTAVSVALPSIQRQLGFGFGALGWVVNAYTLTIAALTLLAGHLADRHGAARIFLLGLAIFILGSLLSGLAFNVVFLIASRSVQGAGVALVAPASLSLVATAFSDRRRGTALGIWAGISASALGIGPIIGAYITESLGWNWIFLLNVPLAAVVWLAAWRMLPRSTPKAAAHRLDLLGVVLSALGLLSLLLALNQATGAGWASPTVVILFAVSALAFALFFVHERGTPGPLVDLSLFKNRFFSAANIITFLSTAVMCSLFFFLALYLQTVLGLSALGSGAALLPLTLTIVVIAPLAGRLVDRLGARVLIVTGMVILAGGLIGLSRLGVGANVVTLMLWLALTGLGIAIARTPTTTTALGSAGGKAFGMAAGVFNTFQAAGLAFGIALMGIILTAGDTQAVFSRDFSAAHHAAFVSGFSIALTLNGAIALFAALLAAYMMRPRPRELR